MGLSEGDASASGLASADQTPAVVLVAGFAWVLTAVAIGIGAGLIRQQQQQQQQGKEARGSDLEGRLLPPGEPDGPPQGERWGSVAWAHIGMVWVGLSFGVWNVLANEVLKERGVPAIVFGFIRAAGSTPLLYMLALWTESVPAPSSIAPRDALQLVLLGFTNGIGDTGTFLLGLQMTSPDIAAVFQPVTPIVCCAMAIAVGLEGMSARKAVGIALGVAGACAMLNVGNLSHAHNAVAGDLVLFGGVLCGAAAVLQQKPLHARFSPVTMTAYSFVASTILFGVVCLFFYRQPADWNWAWGSTDNLLVVCYAIIVCSFVNYATMCFANRHLDGTVITMYAVSHPQRQLVILERGAASCVVYLHMYPCDSWPQS